MGYGMYSQVKKKNTLVSGNAGDEKNLHPDGCKLFFDQFSLDILFSSLVSFALFAFSLFFRLFVCFLKLKIFRYTFNSADG